MLHPGLYEQVINNALTGELAEIPEACKSVAPIDKAEAMSKRHRQQNKEILIRHSPGIGECFFVFKYSINRKK